MTPEELKHNDHEEKLKAAAQAEAEEKYSIEELHQAAMRENNDPEEGLEPIPLWIVALCGLAIFAGGLYLGKYNGGFQSNVFNERQVVFGPVKSTGPKQIDPIASGKRLFTANCATCHQVTGQGVAGQYPPLAGTDQVNGPQNRLIRILLHGLNGPIVVKGNTYNGNMASWKDQLTDQQISYILTYIRQEWGNNSGPISKEAVAAERELVKDRKQPWTWPELSQVAGKDYQDIATSTPAPSPTPAK
ncbi:MAG: cytochrome c [Verrucomicrobiota bacterium]|nr:cytochrome c [Verrucomicrobiota bacterium]